MQRVQLDLKADAGRDAFLRAGRRRPTWSSRASAPASSTASASATTTCGPCNPGIVYCSTSGYGQDGPRVAVGRPRPQLPRRSAASSTAPGAAPTAGPPLPGATVADSAGGGMHAVMAILAALVAARDHRRGRYLDVVDRRRRARAHVALRRRVPGHRRRARPRPRHPHRPLRLLRHLPLRATAAGSRSAPSSPTSARNLCRLLGCERVGRRTRLDDAAQDEIRADFARRVRHPHPRRVGRRARPRPTPACRAGATGAELVDDEQYRGPRRRRRGRARRPHGAFRQVGPVLAGTTATARRRRGPRRRPSPTPTRCCAAAGLDADAIAALRSRRSGRMSDATAERRRRPARRRRRADRPGRSTRRRATSRSSGATSGPRCASVENGNPLFWDDDGRRRAHRRPDRPADDAVGVVPAPPLGARAAPSRRCRCRSTST